jgi:hypothetical protein
MHQYHEIDGSDRLVKFLDDTVAEGGEIISVQLIRTKEINASRLTGFPSSWIVRVPVFAVVTWLGANP